MKMTTQSKIQNQTWRFDPDTGFLRCTASILCAGVMTYQRSELADANPPEALGQTIRMYVSPEELADPEGIMTLEGMPAVIGHTWQTSYDLTECGSICGAPMISGDHLVADLLIKSPDAVNRIMLPEGNPDRLQEISSAGDWSILWEPGFTADGQAYDGLFVKLRYNHVALLPPGAGRAGASVRIINEKEATKMEYTQVRIRNMKSGKFRSIRVANEDVTALEETMAENEEVVEAAPVMSAEEVQAALDELATLKEETKVKTDRIAELEGMIQSYKDQLDAAMSPEAVAEAAAEMTADVDEAATVMNSNGLTLAPEMRRMHGHALRSKVVNSIRVKNGKPELTEEEAKNEGFVKGMFKAQAEQAGAQRAPAGHALVQNSHNAAPNMSDKTARMSRLYPQKDGK